MAEKSGPFNGADRMWKAEDFADYFSPLVTNGFFPSDLNLKVYAEESTMNIIIKPGRAWIDGYQYRNTSDLKFTLDIADGVLKRIDRLVIQYNVTNREIRAVIKKGTPSSQPVPPQIQRNADIYELGVATVFINAGTTSITDSNITDTRSDVTVGGIVNNLFADANAQAKNVMIDDLNEYYVSTNLEGALIELAQPLSYYRSNYDANGIPLTYIARNPAGIRVYQSVLSNPNTDGYYQTRTVSFYDATGNNVRKVVTYSIVYNASGDVVNEVIV